MAGPFDKAKAATQKTDAPNDAAALENGTKSRVQNRVEAELKARIEADDDAAELANKKAAKQKAKREKARKAQQAQTEDGIPHMELLRDNLEANNRLAMIQRGEIEVEVQPRVQNTPEGHAPSVAKPVDWKPGQ